MTEGAVSPELSPGPGTEQTLRKGLLGEHNCMRITEQQSQTGAWRLSPYFTAEDYMRGSGGKEGGEVRWEHVLDLDLTLEAAGVTRDLEAGE